jgi:N-acetylglutamate synthase-like GNAT family acetyltransferase
MSKLEKDLSEYFHFKNFEMRPLTDSDITKVVELLNTAFEYQKIATGYERTSPEHLKKRMDDMKCFLVINQDNIVATVAYEVKNKILHFGLMSVTQPFRGKGLAESIMESIEEYARSLQMETLELDYMSIAPWLKRYYEKYGFKITGHSEEWKGVELIQMQKNLI